MMNNELINRELLLQAIQAIATTDKTLSRMGAGVGDITAFYPYYADNQELFVKVRIDKDGSKWIKPFYYDGNCYRLGEHPATKEPNYKKPLYHLPIAGEVIYIVEGEKCVHSLLEIGLTATTTGGATSIDKCDLTSLQGKRCIVWRDNDKSGQDWQAKLSQALTALDIAYDVIDVDKVQLPTGEPMPAKGDCYDLIQAYFADGQDSSGIIEIIQTLPTYQPLASIEPVTTTDSIKEILQHKKALLLQAIDELTELDEIELLFTVKDVAKKLDIPQKNLLSLVTEKKQGELVKDTEPYTEPVESKALYDELYRLIDSYIVIDEHCKVMFVLWVIFTYLVDISDFAPIAWITAPERECGKSTLLFLFSRVVYKPFTANNITQAVLYRVMEKYKPCLIVDEIDTSLKTKDELLGIVNAGYSRHAPMTPRVNTEKGNAIEAFNSFGAKIFCGIGEMKGTFTSRAIRFELRRKCNDDKPVKRLNFKTLPHEQTELLKRKIKRWSDDNRQTIRQTDIAPTAENRNFDVTEILLQIATVLGVYDKALQACITLSQIKNPPSQNEEFLSNVREVMQGKKNIFRDVLLNELVDNVEWQWGQYNGYNLPMTSNDLTNLFKHYKIISKNVRQGNISQRGYEYSQLEPVFKQYLPPLVQDVYNPFIEND